MPQDPQQLECLLLLGMEVGPAGIMFFGHAWPHNRLSGGEGGTLAGPVGDFPGALLFGVAQGLLGLLAGESGPVRDMVLLNAAAGLVVADLATDLADGVARAAAAVDDGRAAATLERLVTVSRRVAG